MAFNLLFTSQFTVLLIIFVHCTQLLEHWTHDTNYLLWIILVFWVFLSFVGIFSPSFNPGVVVSELYPSWFVITAYLNVWTYCQCWCDPTGLWNWCKTISDNTCLNVIKWVLYSKCKLQKRSITRLVQDSNGLNNSGLL